MSKRDPNAKFLSGIASKSLLGFLLMLKYGYIGQFEITDDHRAGKIVLNLIGSYTGVERSALDLMCATPKI